MTNGNITVDEFKSKFMKATLRSFPEHSVELMPDEIQDVFKEQVSALSRVLEKGKDNTSITSLICFGFIIGHNWVKQNGTLW